MSRLGRLDGCSKVSTHPQGWTASYAGLTSRVFSRRYSSSAGAAGEETVHQVFSDRRPRKGRKVKVLKSGWPGNSSWSARRPITGDYGSIRIEKHYALQDTPQIQGLRSTVGDMRSAPTLHPSDQFCRPSAALDSSNIIDRRLDSLESILCLPAQNGLRADRIRKCLLGLCKHLKLCLNLHDAVRLRLTRCLHDLPLQNLSGSALCVVLSLLWKVRAADITTNERSYEKIIDLLAERAVDLNEHDIGMAVNVLGNLTVASHDVEKNFRAAPLWNVIAQRAYIDRHSLNAKTLDSLVKFLPFLSSELPDIGTALSEECILKISAPRHFSCITMNLHRYGFLTTSLLERLHQKALGVLPRFSFRDTVVYYRTVVLFCENIQPSQREFDQVYYEVGDEGGGRANCTVIEKRQNRSNQALTEAQYRQRLRLGQEIIPSLVTKLAEDNLLKCSAADVRMLFHAFCYCQFIDHRTIRRVANELLGDIDTHNVSLLVHIAYSSVAIAQRAHLRPSLTAGFVDKLLGSLARHSTSLSFEELVKALSLTNDALDKKIFNTSEDASLLKRQCLEQIAALNLDATSVSPNGYLVCDYDGASLNVRVSSQNYLSLTGVGIECKSQRSVQSAAGGSSRGLIIKPLDLTSCLRHLIFAPANNSSIEAFERLVELCVRGGDSFLANFSSMDVSVAFAALSAAKQAAPDSRLWRDTGLGNFLARLTGVLTGEGNEPHIGSHHEARFESGATLEFSFLDWSPGRVSRFMQALASLGVSSPRCWDGFAMHCKRNFVCYSVNDVLRMQHAIEALEVSHIGHGKVIWHMAKRLLPKFTDEQLTDLANSIIRTRPILGLQLKRLLHIGDEFTRRLEDGKIHNLEEIHKLMMLWSHMSLRNSPLTTLIIQRCLACFGKVDGDYFCAHAASDSEQARSQRTIPRNTNENPHLHPSSLTQDVPPFSVQMLSGLAFHVCCLGISSSQTHRKIHIDRLLHNIFYHVPLSVTEKMGDMPNDSVKVGVLLRLLAALVLWGPEVSNASRGYFLNILKHLTPFIPLMREYERAHHRLLCFAATDIHLKYKITNDNLEPQYVPILEFFKNILNTPRKHNHTEPGSIPETNINGGNSHSADELQNKVVTTAENRERVERIVDSIYEEFKSISREFFQGPKIERNVSAGPFNVTICEFNTRVAFEVGSINDFVLDEGGNPIDWNCWALLRHRLLRLLGWKTVLIPYFEWDTTRKSSERQILLRKALTEVLMVDCTADFQGDNRSRTNPED